MTLYDTRTHIFAVVSISYEPKNDSQFRDSFSFERLFYEMRTQTLMTLREAASILRLSKSKLYQERKAGRLATISFGRTIRVREEDLRKYVREAAALR